MCENKPIFGIKKYFFFGAAGALEVGCLFSPSETHLRERMSGCCCDGSRPRMPVVHAVLILVQIIFGIGSVVGKLGVAASNPVTPNTLIPPNHIPAPVRNATLYLFITSLGL